MSFRRMVSRVMKWEQAVVAAIVSAIDDFNRANANPISSPGSDGAITWTSGPGDLGDVQISSNECTRSLGVASGAIVTAPTFGANQMVTITLTASPVGSGIMCRMQGSSSGSGYLLYLQSTGTLQYYHRTEGGTLRQIGSNLNMTAVGAGDTISLKVTGTGTITLEAFRNGVSIDSRTDSTNPYNSGQPGIYFGTGTSINSFSATNV
jgi:hypothetical protein